MTLTRATVLQAQEMERVFNDHPARALIGKLDTIVTTLRMGQLLLPVTINDRRLSPTCYLCCPSVAYIAYAREELRNLAESPAAKRAMDSLLRLAAPLMRMTGFDHQIQPNNWLLATNICCALNVAEIHEVTQELCAFHPGMAIVWRSLNDVSDARMLAFFRACGYGLYPARQVYLFDCRQGPVRVHRDEKRDTLLLAQPDFSVVEPRDIALTDFQRIEVLYAKLYLQKYTYLNPQYSALWLQQMHEAGVLQFYGLRNRDGQLDGIAGFFDRGDVMSAPVVGYDTTIDLKAGLYRRLMAIALQRARDRRLLFNMSAGAAAFKRNRGGIAAIEYSAIYNRHLSWKNRAAATFVRAILRNIGIPIMRNYRL
ncbi:GNAT family N-acetyltransferase [Rhizobium sp. 2YAF20]|uniref:GNAT family N-acetyltransferase n=1 Tax=Rhizobium sp. 2YAF20 TaxID=3233027 RepID=UPI003F95EBDF